MRKRPKRAAKLAGDVRCMRIMALLASVGHPSGLIALRALTARFQLAFFFSVFSFGKCMRDRGKPNGNECRTKFFYLWKLLDE
jgi:hypothetical protein